MEAVPSVPIVVSSKQYSLHKWRLSLRISACVCAAISLILACADGAQCSTAVGYYSYNYDSYYASDCWLGYTIVLLPIAGAAILWNIVEFITLCANKKGIHPGAHIALDFLLFGALIAGSVISILLGQPTYNYDYYSSYYLPADQLALAAGSMGIIAGIFHLVLFIMACIAVHHWRRTRETQVTYIQPPMVAGTHGTLPPPPPGMMYLVPIPGGGAQQPSPGSPYVSYPAPALVAKA